MFYARQQILPVVLQADQYKLKKNGECVHYAQKTLLFFYIRINDFFICALALFLEWMYNNL